MSTTTLDNPRERDYVLIMSMTISRQHGKETEGGKDADVLQALAITTAVRTAMADAAEQGGAGFSLELLDVEVEPANRRALRVA